MRVRALLLLGLVLVVTIPALARAPISVSPSSGSRTARFTVRFRAPARTGVVGQRKLRYSVSARGPAFAGCEAASAATVSGTRKGQTVRVALVPDRRGWCAGNYSGEIDELASPVCSGAQLCPQYVARLRRVGTFRFRVR